MSELPLNQILCGDCVEVLKDFPDNSIDLVVTDPPYGLSFMGKDWDKTLPPKEAFAEIIRVLKPGALAFVMSSPRQDLMARMIMLLEDAGFNTSLSFMDWIYKTGFPKAYDVSKGIDRIKKTDWTEFMELRTTLIQKYEKSGISRKTLSEKMGVTLRQIDHWFKYGESQPQIPSLIRIDQLSKYMKIPKTFQKMRDYLNSINYRTKAITVKEIKTFRNKQGWAREAKGGMYAPGDKKYSITKPFSPLANQWEGWKSQTGLKPAHEPILMVNKPFTESTIVKNVLKWGTGAINVDVCRIPFQPNESAEDLGRSSQGFTAKSGTYHNDPKYEISSESGHQKGRFPANLLVSDKALDTGKISRSPNSYVRMSDGFNKDSYGIGMGESKGKKSLNYGDVGDQSRYFDLDAWAEHHGFLDVPKPDNKERDFGLKGVKRIPTSKLNLSDGKNPVRLDGEIPNPRRNIHPTVKPIKLMAYLIELGCPPDGIVLDPFVGSGTTCIAAKQLVRKYVGIEINPEYAKMAQARIKAHPVPLSWFDEDVGVPPNVQHFGEKGEKIK